MIYEWNSSMWNYAQYFNIAFHFHFFYYNGVRLLYFSVEIQLLTGPLPTPRWYTRAYKALVEWYWLEKPKDLERNLSQCHFVHHKSTWTALVANPGPCSGKSACNWPSPACCNTCKLSISLLWLVVIEQT
jgi:hypothetical protein